MERPEVIELIGKFCLYSPMMIPYRVVQNPRFVEERLEIEMVTDYGELYGLIFLS
jgi:hypothetical protein